MRQAFVLYSQFLASHTAPAETLFSNVLNVEVSDTTGADGSKKADNKKIQTEKIRTQKK